MVISEQKLPAYDLSGCSGKEMLSPLSLTTMTKKLPGLQDFLQLSESEQFDLLQKEGVHVGKRKVGHQSVLLFQLYSFYVEVYYKQYRKVVDHIRTSESTEILQPYLDQIHIRDLKKGNNLL